MLPRRFRPRPGSRWLLRAPRTPSPAGLVLTVRVWQLSHSRHEGLLGHVAARALLHEGLLVRAVQLLGELDGLQGCQAAGHTVDDGDALCLGRVEACGSKRERSDMESGMRRGQWMRMAHRQLLLCARHPAEPATQENVWEMILQIKKPKLDEIK